MKRSRVAPVLAFLVARAVDLWAGAPAPAAAPLWYRQIEFARKLSTRKYFDLAELVQARLEADPDIIGIEKAMLYRKYGEYYSEMAPVVAVGKDWLNRFLEYLGKSRTYYQKYLDHPSIKDARRYASDRFDVRQRLSWLSVYLAEGHARFLEDADAAKELKDKHKAEAIRIFKAAIEEFQTGIAEKDREFKDALKREPTTAGKDKELWLKELDRVRDEFFGIRLQCADVRIRYAKFLREAKVAGPETMGVLTSVENDLKQLLLDGHGRLSVVPANLLLARCHVEQGPQRDKDAEERLDEVWKCKDSLIKMIPCQAHELKASIQLRQKRLKEALDTLDAMMKFRTNNVWEPEVRGVGDKATRLVTGILDEIEGDPREQFDQRATAGAFLLMADVCAAMAEEAEKAKKPAKDVQALYGTAFDIAAGVGDAKVPLDRKYIDRIELWRTKARRPVSLFVLDQKLRKLHAEDKWVDCARVLTEIITRSNPPPDKARDLWFRVATYYYFAKRYYEAATAFWAVSRWFPTRDRERPGRLAIGSLAAMDKLVKSSVHERQILRWRLELEGASEEGPGPLLVNEAAKLREDKEYDKALKSLGQVKPTSAVYPDALYQIALTRRAIFENIPEAERKTDAAKKALKAMLDSLQAVDAHYQKTIKDLEGDEHADARKHLIKITGAALASRCGLYLENYINDPAKALELSADVEKKYPGIEAAPSLPVIYYYRMHAAYRLAKETPAQAEKYLAILEEAWKVLRDKYGNTFAFLDRAATIGAGAYGELGAKYEAAATKETDPAKKKDLEEKAAAARNRALEFWLDLVTVNPNQSLQRYLMILRGLYSREVTPRSNDYRKITELAPKILEMFKDVRDPRAADSLLLVKALLGLSYAQLQMHKDAILVLEEVENAYESAYQKEMARYKIDKEKYDARSDAQRRKVRPPAQPKRHAIQPDVKSWLARAYLGANARDKYAKALDILTDLVSIWAVAPDPKDRIKYWDGYWGVCEAYRRLGKYPDSVKYVGRANLDSGGEFGNKEYRDRFRELTHQLRKDVEKVADAKQRDDLIRQIEQVLTQMKK